MLISSNEEKVKNAETSKDINSKYPSLNASKMIMKAFGDSSFANADELYF